MDFIGSLKPWMSEHVFVTIGIAVAIAVAFTLAILSITQYGRRNIYLLLFRLMALATVALGTSELVVAVQNGAPASLIEISIGTIIVTLIGYAAAMQVVYEHAIEGRAAKSALAKLKEQSGAIRLVVDGAKPVDKH